MKHNVTAPSVGESITEVSILKWAKQAGSKVKGKIGSLTSRLLKDPERIEIQHRAARHSAGE